MEREGGHVLEQLVCECVRWSRELIRGFKQDLARYRSSYLVLVRRWDGNAGMEWEWKMFLVNILPDWNIDVWIPEDTPHRYW